MKTITVDRQSFGINTNPRTGTAYVFSIHPYDETEYHWARQEVTGHSWVVFRERKRVCILGSLTEEQVAAKLLNLDRAAHLTRRGGIW